MKINHTGVLLAALVGTRHALRITDPTANATAGVFGIENSAAAFASESAPPLPPRPTPKSSEPYLPLFLSANDEVWDKAKCKGANFVRAMCGSDRDAGQVFKPPRDSAASQWENLDFNAAERDLGMSDKCYGWGGWIDCVIFLHGFKQDEQGDWEPDDSPYVVDGRTYRRSGAHYGLAFDSLRGVIMALDRDSPQSAGKDLNPPVQGDGLPAIQASSDIMWLYWKMYDKPKGPNYFLSSCIINAETQAVVSRAIRETIPEAHSYPAWGGYDFDTDTPEGQAILGTPNAQAFSYFLLQHKATLGNLYISQVRVFRDSKQEQVGPSILFIVEPVPTPASNETKHSFKPYGDISRLFAGMKRHQSAPETVNVAAKRPADLPAPAPLVVQPKPTPDLFSPGPSDTYLDLYPDAEDEEWTKAQCKGANFVNAMRGSDREAGKIFNPPRDTAAGFYNENSLDDLTDWGWSGKEATEPNMKYYGIEHVLRGMGSSDRLFADGGDIRLVSFAHGISKQGDNGEWMTIGEQHYEVNGKSYRYTGAWYKFALDEVNGILIATDRMSPQEIGSEASPPITGSDLPLIRAFSDLAWISWATLAAQTQTDVKNMHYFMSLSISNKLTQRVLSRCVREVLPGAWGFPAWPGFEFESDSEHGKAILGGVFFLGTPNAQAFSYFLLQHKKELGNLHISKMRVFHDANWIAKANLLLVIEPVAEDGDESDGADGNEEGETGEKRWKVGNREANGREKEKQQEKGDSGTLPRQRWNRAKL
ncbi:hypothetical protein SVAN01_02753 [Stagonosporopsis vannaccii]|nr:hypothetical protein SVAN01_02753 [Stagonosporopsis vannaccii]